MSVALGQRDPCNRQRGQDPPVPKGQPCGRNLHVRPTVHQTITITPQIVGPSSKAEHRPEVYAHLYMSTILPLFAVLK